MVGQCPRLNENRCPGLGLPQNEDHHTHSNHDHLLSRGPSSHPGTSRVQRTSDQVKPQTPEGRDLRVGSSSGPHRTSLSTALQVVTRARAAHRAGSARSIPKDHQCDHLNGAHARAALLRARSWGDGEEDVDLVDEDGRTRHAQANRWDSEEVASEFFRGCCENWSSYRPTD